MKIGLLYPVSKAYPNADIDFADAFVCCIERELGKGRVEVCRQRAGFGGSERDLYEKVEQLLRFERVDLIVAFIDLKVLATVQPLLVAAGKSMIVVNPGANHPHNWAGQPGILHLNLQHAFLSWLNGREAASGGKPAAYATTFYDCGYMHGIAMQNGFIDKGGQTVHHYINNQPYNEKFEISGLLSFLSAHQEVDRVLCAFDTVPAALLFDRLHQDNDVRDLQLYATPMMLHQEAWADNDPTRRFSVRGYIPWHRSVQSETNQFFIQHFGAYSNREASLFALLGWEAALAAAVICRHEANRDPDAMVELFTKVPLESPRGNMYFDPDTHHFLAPFLQSHLEKGAVKSRIEQVELKEHLWREFTGMETDSISSGWTNTYLCY